MRATGVGPVIDMHAHFLPASLIQSARQEKRWFGTEVAISADGMPSLTTNGRQKVLGSKAYWEQPSERLARMEATGVDTQVISVAPILYRYNVDVASALASVRDINDEIASWMSGWPDRFLGYASLPLQDIDASIEEMERAMRRGFVGVSVGTHVEGENWDSPRLLPVLEAAERLGAIAFLHPTNQRTKGTVSDYHLGNLIGNPYETTVAAGSLIFGGVLDKVPRLRVLLSHAGGFAYANAGRFDHGYRSRDDASAAAARLPSEYLAEMYFDCIAHDGLVLRHLIDLVGVHQVVLGTDYPADMGLADPRGFLESCAQLTAEERRMIFGVNATRLLGMDRELG